MPQDNVASWPFCTVDGGVIFENILGGINMAVVRVDAPIAAYNFHGKSPRFDLSILAITKSLESTGQAIRVQLPSLGTGVVVVQLLGL